MIDYIETKTSDGTPIRIEVETSSKSGAGFARSSPAAEAEAAKDAYNQTLNTIRACANGVIETLQNLEAAPSAASINFAIKVDAEAGATVAKSVNDAQFKISLSWKQVEPDADEGKEKEE